MYYLCLNEHNICSNKHYSYYMNAQMNNEKLDKLMRIINTRELSRLLTGQPDTIRTKYIPEQYKEDVQTLTDMIVQWHNERIARRSIKMIDEACEEIEKPSENETEQTNTQEEIVQAKENGVITQEMKKGSFHRVANNIYTNNICYQVKAYKDGRMIEEYFATYLGAVDYLSGNMSGKTE